MEKDAFYFPHFSNARLDRKIKRVRKELGLEGYGIYFMILETLRDQENFNFPVDDIDLLADEFGTSEQKVRAVIANYDLFLINEDNNFFSPKLLVFLQPYLEGKHKRRIGGIKGNLIKYKHVTREQANEMNELQILELHNNISFKSTFNALPSPTESDTEQDTDRFGSQIQYNSTQDNTSKVNTIKDIGKEQKAKLPRHKYGEFNNVLLTDKEFNELVVLWDMEKTMKHIEELSIYIDSKGAKYKNFKSTLIGWEKRSKEFQNYNPNNNKSNYNENKWHQEANFDF